MQKSKYLAIIFGMIFILFRYYILAQFINYPSWYIDITGALVALVIVLLIYIFIKKGVK